MTFRDNVKWFFNGDEDNENDVVQWEVSTLAWSVSDTNTIEPIALPENNIVQTEPQKPMGVDFLDKKKDFWNFLKPNSSMWVWNSLLLEQSKSNEEVKQEQDIAEKEKWNLFWDAPTALKFLVWATDTVLDIFSSLVDKQAYKKDKSKVLLKQLSDLWIDNKDLKANMFDRNSVNWKWSMYNVKKIEEIWDSVYWISKKYTDTIKPTVANIDSLIKEWNVKLWAATSLQEQAEIYNQYKTMVSEEYKKIENLINTSNEELKWLWISKDINDVSLYVNDVYWEADSYAANIAQWSSEKRLEDKKKVYELLWKDVALAWIEAQQKEIDVWEALNKDMYEKYWFDEVLKTAMTNLYDKPWINSHRLANDLWTYTSVTFDEVKKLRNMYNMQESYLDKQIKWWSLTQDEIIAKKAELEKYKIYNDSLIDKLLKFSSMQWMYLAQWKDAQEANRLADEEYIKKYWTNLQKDMLKWFGKNVYSDTFNHLDMSRDYANRIQMWNIRSSDAPIPEKAFQAIETLWSTAFNAFWDNLRSLTNRIDPKWRSNTATENMWLRKLNNIDFTEKWVRGIRRWWNNFLDISDDLALAAETFLIMKRVQAWWWVLAEALWWWSTVGARSLVSPTIRFLTEVWPVNWTISSAIWAWQLWITPMDARIDLYWWIAWESYWLIKWIWHLIKWPTNNVFDIMKNDKFLYELLNKYWWGKASQKDIMTIWWIVNDAEKFARELYATNPAYYEKRVKQSVANNEVIWFVKDNVIWNLSKIWTFKTIPSWLDEALEQIKNWDFVLREWANDELLWLYNAVKDIQEKWDTINKWQKIQSLINWQWYLLSPEQWEYIRRLLVDLDRDTADVFVNKWIPFRENWVNYTVVDWTTISTKEMFEKLWKQFDEWKTTYTMTDWTTKYKLYEDWNWLAVLQKVWKSKEFQESLDAFNKKYWTDIKDIYWFFDNVWWKLWVYNTNARWKQFINMFAWEEISIVDDVTQWIIADIWDGIIKNAWDPVSSSKLYDALRMETWKATDVDIFQAVKVNENIVDSLDSILDDILCN